MTDSVTIICTGSPFGADHIGYKIAERLKRDGLTDVCPACSIEIEYLDRPGTRLLGYLRRAEKVILIDAMKAGDVPGTVRRIEPNELEQAQPLSGHGIGVAEALALGDALGELPGKLVILGAEVGEGDEPSLDEIVQTIRRQFKLELDQ